MTVSRILRAVALLCLAFASHFPVVNAGEDSAIIEAINKPSTFTEPSTLKDLLDLIGKLGSFNKKAKVLDKVSGTIKEPIQQYLNTKGIPGKGVKKNLKSLIKKISELRKKILKDPKQFGNYSDLTESDIDVAGNALIYWLPILHSELWFLHFQTAEECVNLGGGGWRRFQKFGESHGTTQLHRWLTDKLDKKAVPLIPKGFSTQDLIDNGQGNNITSSTGIKFDRGGPLNHAQYGLFLLSPTWHDSNLGSAVLFLQEFCRGVEGSKFDKYMYDEKYGGLQSVCESVSAGLTSLSDTIHPLYDGSIITYKDKLRPEAFPKYVYWLLANLSPMKKALDQMLSESKEWSRDVFANAGSPGTFKYGFVFRNDKFEESIKDKLPPAIAALTMTDSGSLNVLHSLLVPKPSQESVSIMGVPESEANDEI